MNPFSKAAAYKKGLKLDPSCGCACIALLNLLDLKLYPPTIANTFPVLGSMLTRALWTSGCIEISKLFPSDFLSQIRSPASKKSEKFSKFFPFLLASILGFILVIKLPK